MHRFKLSHLVALLCLLGGGNLCLAGNFVVDAAGGGNYTTLAAAINDINNDLVGPEPHTITVTDNLVNPINARITIIRDVTITNAPGDTPVFVVDQTNLGNNYIFYVANAHTVVVQNLTFIGNSGSSPSDSDNGLFRLENGGGGGPLNFTLRNCLVSGNNGSDQPVTNYTLSPSTVTGYFYHAVLPWRGGNNAPINTTIEGCTFAYCTRGVAIYNDPASTGGSFTMTNTLITQRALYGLLLGAFNFNGNPFVIDECAFLTTDDTEADTEIYGIFATGGSNLNMTVTDTVFRTRWGHALRFDGFAGGTLTAQRITAHVGRQVLLCVGLTGGQTFNLVDFVWRWPGTRITNGAFDMRSTSGTETYNLNNLGIFEGRWDAYDGGPGQSPQFAAAIGIEGTFSDDPTFVRDVVGAADNGRIGWNRGDNTLFDVNNPTFIGQGTPGQRANNALTGGADPGPLVPVELSTLNLE